MGPTNAFDTFASARPELKAEFAASHARHSKKRRAVALLLSTLLALAGAAGSSPSGPRLEAKRLAARLSSDVDFDGAQLLDADGVRVDLWDVRLGRRLRTLLGHTNEVVALALSPDGKQALTASGDQTEVATDPPDRSVRLWNLATGREIRRMRLPDETITSLGFSADGRRALGLGGHSGEVWDVATGRRLLLFGGVDYGHPPEVGIGASLSQDGARLLKIGDSATVREVATGKVVARLDQKGRFVSAAFSPDDRAVVTTDWRDDDVRLWDAATGRPLQTFRGSTSSVAPPTFSPNGRVLVAGSEDGTLRAWSCATGREAWRSRCPGRIERVLLSPDGRRGLALWVSGHPLPGTIGYGATLWDAATGREIARLDGVHGYRTDAIAGFSPDGKTFLVVPDYKGGLARLRSAETGAVLRAFPVPRPWRPFLNGHPPRESEAAPHG